MSKPKDLCECGGNKDKRAKKCSSCAKKGYTSELIRDKTEKVVDASKLGLLSISKIAENAGVSRNFARNVLKEIGFDFSTLRPFRTRLPLDCHIFKIDVKRRNAPVLAYIRRHNLLPNFCSECGLGETWNGKPLKLQLDHKDGNSCNNLFENLRLLCPNCHSQTETFTGRNLK